MRKWEGNQGSIIEKPERNKRKHKKEGLLFTIQTVFERFSYGFIMSQGSTVLRTVGIILHSMNNQWRHSPQVVQDS